MGGGARGHPTAGRGSESPVGSARVRVPGDPDAAARRAHPTPFGIFYRAPGWHAPSLGPPRLRLTRSRGQRGSEGVNDQLTGRSMIKARSGDHEQQTTGLEEHEGRTGTVRAGSQHARRSGSLSISRSTAGSRSLNGHTRPYSASSKTSALGQQVHRTEPGTARSTAVGRVPPGRARAARCPRRGRTG